MRKGLIIGTGVVVLGAAIAAMALLRPAPSEDRLAPPVPASLDDVDPLVAALVRERLDAVETRPDDVATRAELAMAYHANGMHELALRVYEQCVELAPDHARCWYHLGRLRTDLGDLDGGLAALETVATLEPGYAPAHWRRGFWMLDDGRFDEAERFFRAAIRCDPRDPTGAIGLARVHRQRGAFAEMVELLEPVARQYPELLYARQLLGWAYRGLGDEAKAAAHLDRNEGLVLHWPDPWHRDVVAQQTGYAARIKESDRLVAAGRTGEAVEALEALREHFPEDAVLLAKLGEVYMRAGQADLAVARLTSAQRHDPGYYPASLHLATISLNRGNPQRALEHADRAIELNPTFGHAHRLRATALTSLAPPRFEDAAEALASALRYGAGGTEARTDYAAILLELRRCEEASEVLRRVLAEEAPPVVAWALLCIARTQCGDLAGAETALGRARALDAEHPMAQRAEEYLRRAQWQQGRAD